MRPAEGDDRPSVIRELRHPDGVIAAPLIPTAGIQLKAVPLGVGAEIPGAVSGEPTLHLQPVISETFCKRRIGEALVYQCVNLDLVQDAVDPTADLVVFADTLHIGGHVHLPGRKVFVFARELIADPDGQIDTGALSPDGPAEKRPLAEQLNTAPGAPGADGIRGAPGDQAGTVGGRRGGDISIVAGRISGRLGLGTNGGDGQDGQPGGDGRPGMAGPNGEDARSEGSGSPGGAGGRGGAAGPGGSGGPGGRAGAINVTIGQPPSDGVPAFLWEAKGGRGGKPGPNGRP